MYEGIHEVKRAIIMAAGMGKRMQPVTLTIPKPLVKVNGVRMIDTIINGLHINGIYEIYVVTGYMSEQFYSWAEEWQGVTLIDNPYYDVCNNISSLYMARNYLEDCIILDGDQIINNPKVLSSHFDVSGYNAVWTDESTDEWLLDVSDGTIRSCSRYGGSHGWQLYSISRWTKSDGMKLRGHLEEEFECGNRQIYWDDIALFCYPGQYRLGIWKMQKEDVIEIDDMDELIRIDQSYEDWRMYDDR